MVREEGAAHPFASTISLVESATKVIGAVVFVGYVALRGHYNRLGLSLIGVGKERYLMEAVHFADEVASRAGRLLPPAAILLGVALLARRAYLSARRKRAASPETDPSSWFWRVEASLLIGAAATTYLVAKLGEPTTYDIAVGPLCESELRAARFIPIGFEILMAATMAAFAYMKISSLWGRPAFEASSLEACLLRVARGAWWLVALYIPWTFGLVASDSKFPNATVQIPSDKQGGHTTETLDGLLVAESEGSVTLWQDLDGGIGQTVVIAHPERITLFKSEDILLRAQEAARTRHGANDDATIKSNERPCSR